MSGSSHTPPSLVEWSRDGDTWIGVFLPGLLGILREHVDGLRSLAVQRLEQYAAGVELEPLDCRLANVLETRRQVLGLAGQSELEMLFPVTNRLARMQRMIPADGGIMVLHDWEERHLCGTVALELSQAILAMLMAWARGERVGGVARPEQNLVDMFDEQQNWLCHEIAMPLGPRPDEHLPSLPTR